MRGLASAGLLALLAACGAPPDPAQQVGYRDGTDGATSGERGTIKITEIGWAGSVTNEGVWDPEDVFLEIRNEGVRPARLDGWFIEMEGLAGDITWRVPEMEEALTVGDHLVVAAKTSGCYPNADIVIPGMYFGHGDAFRVTLLDADERLIEPAGDKRHRPFAGIYDGQVVRSMEKIELVFGGRGNESKSWHHYTNDGVNNADGQPSIDVPNNDEIAENCRERTLASPGRPNSPDYSGAFSAGGTD